jgi:hypothetical protein
VDGEDHKAVLEDDVISAVPSGKNRSSSRGRASLLGIGLRLPFGMLATSKPSQHIASLVGGCFSSNARIAGWNSDIGSDTHSRTGSASATPNPGQKGISLILRGGSARILLEF